MMLGDWLIKVIPQPVLDGSIVALAVVCTVGIAYGIIWYAVTGRP